MRDRVFHQVPYHLVLDWLDVGWQVAIPNGPTVYLHYGVIMEWLCGCKMPRPR